MALIGNDATLIALASAFGGAIVSGLFTLAGARLNHKHEAKREKERADRDDQREHERAEKLSHERLDDLRRMESVRLITSASLLVALRPALLTEELIARLASADAALNDADDTLQLLGPDELARAGFDLASATRRYSNSGAKGGLPENYTRARAEFFRVAKNSLGYGTEPDGIKSTTAPPQIVASAKP